MVMIIKKCLVCGGTGKVASSVYPNTGYMEICSKCGGTGNIAFSDDWQSVWERIMFLEKRVEDLEKQVKEEK